MPWYHKYSINYPSASSAPTHEGDGGGKTRSIPEPGKEESINNLKVMDFDQPFVLVLPMAPARVA